MYIVRETGANYQTVIDYFISHAKADGPAAFLLHGMPFAGKTEMAKQVFEQVKEEDVAEKRWVPSFENPESNSLFAVQDGLQKPVLFVLDGLENADVLQAILARFSNKKVWLLVTARNPFLNQTVFTETNRLWVERFADSEAQKLLRAMLRDEQSYPDEGLARLNQVVGGNPGLLSVVGQSLASHRDYRLEEALQNLQANDKNALFNATLRVKEPGKTSQPRKLGDIYTTWVDGLPPLGKEIVLHLAFFAPERLIDPHWFVNIFDEDYSYQTLVAAFAGLAGCGLLQPLRDGYLLPILTADYLQWMARERTAQIVGRLGAAFLRQIGAANHKSFVERGKPLYPHLKHLAKTADAQGRRIRPVEREALWGALIAYERKTAAWDALLESLGNRQILIEARQPGIHKTRALLDGLCEIIEAHQNKGSETDVRNGLESLAQECDQWVPMGNPRAARKELRAIVAEKRDWMQKKWDALDAQPTTVDEEREALTRREKAYAQTRVPGLRGRERLQKADICMRQGILREDKGRLRAAQEKYEEAHDAVEELLPPTHAVFKRILWHLGRLYLRRKSYRRAEEVFTVLLGGCTTIEERVDCRTGLGMALLGQQSVDAALAQFAAAEEVEETRSKPSLENLTMIALHQGAAYFMGGDLVDAQVFLTLAQDRAMDPAWKCPSEVSAVIAVWKAGVEAYAAADRKTQKETRTAIQIAKLEALYRKKTSQAHQAWTLGD
ncbi:MAG: tetratricopeptide repeat protein [Anaerolineae bacterium]|jgi:tetratricopeptide (TPR) repeat protein|nr:tetratricopeptide repeat protein [Anaerolineae bacterium]